MKASDFTHFYTTLHNRPPFPWQKRLAEQVMGNGSWPRLLSLPTGSGKTSVLDIAIFALACTADLPNQRAPRRIFYVVDRRIIVDSTFEYSKRIANELRQAMERKSGGIVGDVAHRLQQLTGGDDLDSDPLHVAMLRGGMYREDAWARSPVQPTICVSTVDQIGSRLLFRGYGVREASWPIHAGLIANDSLLILDEAHISRPFSQTLSLVQHYCGPDWSDHLTRKTFSFVKMTATPEAGDGDSEPFCLSAEDERNEVLSLRLAANKMATLEEIDDTSHEEQSSAFARKLCSFAYELTWPSEMEVAAAKAKRSGKGPQNKDRDPDALPAKIVGIVVNRVATARAIFELIRSDANRRECEAILLTGRVRPYDRDELLYNAPIDGMEGGWLKYIKADKDRPTLDRPLFVVATQTIEVGADLDFDAIVTEIAPLDAIRQRFGRVDRLGLRKFSRSYIVARSSSVGRDADDWLYGEALKATWKLLGQIAKKKTIDFGIAALKSQLAAIGTEQLHSAALTGRTLNAPVLLPAHVDALCQTNPTPAAEPDIALLLHGGQVAAEVHIVWRSDLPVPFEGKDSKGVVAKSILKSLELLPPTTIESLALPFPIAKRWLESKAAKRRFTDHEMVDIEGGAPNQETRGSSAEQFIGVRWRGLERSELVRASEIRPGDTIVIPDYFGGVDRFGWNPESHESVADISEVCNRIVRRELVLRIPSLRTPSWLWANKDEETQKQVQDLRTGLKTAQDTETLQESSELVAQFLRSNSFPRWVGDVSSIDAAEVSVFPHPLDGWILMIDRELSAYNPAFESGNYDKFGGDDDNPSFQRSRRPIPLNTHLHSVGNELRFWCSKLQMDGLTRTVCLAGDLHDVGKADPRFQAYLHGGNVVAALRTKGPLAKSGTAYWSREENRRAHELAQLPGGFRHEALSVAMVANTSAHQVDSDLLLHLIGTHHGYGRPLLPIVEDTAGEEVHYEFRSASLSSEPNHKLHRVEKGWPDRFWRMTRRFGWWGCAYLETLVRLADRSVSEQEQRRNYAPPSADPQPINLICSNQGNPRAAETDIPLDGINGENPLGFLAALGTFRLLSEGLTDRNVLLSWFWDGYWKPSIQGFGNSSELLDVLWAALNSTKLAVAAFLKQYLTPYANLTISDADFRALLLDAALRSAQGERFVSDCYVALGSDAHPTQKGQIADTALRTLSGAGHQDFLGSMRTLAEAAKREHVEAALFSEWQYLDGWRSLRWDPQEDRRYALRAEDPSGEKTQSVPGANRLAFETLPLFPTFACPHHVVTRCFSGRGMKTVFSWPIWSCPVSLDALGALLSHSELVEEKPNEDKLRPLGVEEILRASRITVGHFRNFTPSRALWGASLAAVAG